MRDGCRLTSGGSRGEVRRRVDLAPEMIRRATELARAVESVRFLVADSEQLPFGDGAFTAQLVPPLPRSSPCGARDGSSSCERRPARHRRCVRGSAHRAHRRCRPPPDRAGSRSSLRLERTGVVPAASGGLPRDASEALRWGVRDRPRHRGVAASRVDRVLIPHHRLGPLPRLLSGAKERQLSAAM